MPYVLKTVPVDAVPGQTVTIAQRPFYGGKNIRAGDTVFLWFFRNGWGPGARLARHGGKSRIGWRR